MIGFISEKLLIPILDFFYGLVPSYGLAIVALTVVIRSALFPLSAGSIRSARRMKIAQPVMQKRQAEIKSKFSSDPKKQQEELGKLMNEFGVKTEFNDEGVSISKCDIQKDEVEIDFRDCPDLTQTILVVAAVHKIKLKISCDTFYSWGLNTFQAFQIQRAQKT